MHASLAAALLAALLPLQALAQPLGAGACRELRQRRNQLASEAMQAELALVIATRRRLCPQQEALAEQANAGTLAAAAGSGADQAGQADGPKAAPPQLDYEAYLQCRRQAEQQLRRSRAVLHTNLNGFSFYTLSGARLARSADAVQQRLNEGCEPPAAAAGAAASRSAR